MSTVMLIDGNSLTYRAFFALPTDLATASGQVTNAVYGFTSMLINLLRDHRPDRVAVAFDRPEPTFRHEVVETYKANREAAPDILRQQIGLVREVVEKLGIAILEVPGYEADDIIATLATRARDAGHDVLIVTGDRDTFQLVEDPHVRVLYNRKGVSDYALYDEAGIESRTGVPPSKYVLYAALRGDPSDNLPGVPGVGEKTAAKLVNTYGDLDGIFSHLDELSPKLRSSLADHEAQVRRNAEVMKLVGDVDLEVDLDELELGAVDLEEVRKLFEFLEFRSLFDRLVEALGERAIGGADSRGGGVLEAEVRLLEDCGGALDLLASLRAEAEVLAVAPAWAGIEGRSPLEGIAFVTDAAAAEVVWLPATLLAEPSVTDALATFTGRDGRPLATHDAKAVMRGLAPYGVDVRSLALDTMIAAYLIDPAESRYPLAEVLERFTGMTLPAGAAVAEGQLDFGDGGVPAWLDAGRRALAVAFLVEPLTSTLDARGLRALNDDVETPLVRVLAKMEIAGIGVDVDELRRLSDSLADDCERLRRQVWADAGHEFNVNSTPQLRQVLFEELGLTPQKKTKTGYSTDAASLERLLGEHPIIEHLLQYREVEKLRSTYGEGLLAEVAPDGRIHATFNQTVARTGRLSSDAPNLHNIPVRSEIGRAFRKAFVPAPGYEFTIADYNQIELRCIAHLAEDPGLIAAFESGEDIHTATAARVFGVDPAAVTLDQRAKAKMVSYGLAYGMEAYGLGQRLGISTSEAQEILDAYFEAFPAVRAYMERTVAEARERGYTETLFGRRRQIPELSSSNVRIRQAGERQAMNAGIQGLAADIFKVALVRLDAALEEQRLDARLVLQVHDEVLVESRPAERDAVTAVVLDAMCGAFDLRVPLEVNLTHGSTWADAKG
ncbi:DNA polymerase I [Rhabdothermincola sp.]|uniref:DNA polymerase I n=1 Tax=Rhabdothermincola sp. TaxID=2820405 RepID=UPI002FE41144